jgi:hypothetical protein
VVKTNFGEFFSFGKNPKKWKNISKVFETIK